MPEPGDEDLSLFALDCKYHAPFERTVFALRKDPDPAIPRCARGLVMAPTGDVLREFIGKSLLGMPLF